jgi:hypothetical protein
LWAAATIIRKKWRRPCASYVIVEVEAQVSEPAMSSFMWTLKIACIFK